MKKFQTYILILLTLVLLWPTTAFAKESFDDKVVFGGTYTLESDETHDGSLVVFGGAVTIEPNSTVNGDVVLIGGTVEIGGSVNGSVVGIGGAVRLNEDAYINGDLFTLGATLRREEGARVNGQVINGIDVPTTFNVPDAIEGGDFIPSIPAQPPVVTVKSNPFLEIIWFFFRIFLYAALAVLLVMFLPKHVERVRSAALEQPMIAGGAGLLTAILAPLVLVAITITIILIPVTLLTILLLFVAWFIGWVALGSEVGIRIAKSIKVEMAPAISAGIGTLILFFVFGGFRELIPCLGLVPFILIGLWGLGAVLITRFGTQGYSTSSVAISDEAQEALPEGVDVAEEDKQLNNEEPDDGEQQESDSTCSEKNLAS
jgi:hypothetical protein